MILLLVWFISTVLAVVLLSLLRVLIDVSNPCVIIIKSVFA